MIATSWDSGDLDLFTVLKGYAQVRNLELGEVMLDQAAKLSCSNFGGDNKGLFQYAADTAPNIEELLALPQRLGWRIKRKGRPVFTQTEQRVAKSGKYKGQMRTFRVKRKTGDGAGKALAKGEINIRIARRFYQAIGWLAPMLSKYERQMNGVQAKHKRKAPPATVTLRLEGDQISVIITNRAKNSQEVNMRHGNYVQVALNARKADMLDYLERKLSELTERMDKANG